MQWYVYREEDNNLPDIIKVCASREEAKEFLKDYYAFRNKWSDCGSDGGYVYHIGNDFDLPNGGNYFPVI